MRTMALRVWATNWAVVREVFSGEDFGLRALDLPPDLAVVGFNSGEAA
jgi:hypothetical protein